MRRSSYKLIGAALVAAALAGGFVWWKRTNSPANSAIATLKVPEGFKVEKVAGSDLISYPMLGTFDDTGRLFICESSGNTLNNQQMADNPDYQIRLLEDKDGDGKFDHSQVFASKLTLPAGAVWYRNSLYVAAPPDLWRFEDTNGDGVADKKEAVVTGWKMSSNAASLHGPVMGPDGWLYLTDGRHGFNIHTKDGRHYEGKASRIWRVRPDGTGLEWVAGGGFDNPVEVVFTPEGEVIGTMTYYKDPENGQRDALMHFVEGGVYPKWYSVVSEFKRTGELMPVMTRFARIAPSGLLRYQGGGLGEEFDGNLFSAQFNPHRVQRHVMTAEKSSYRTEDTDFLTSSDPDFHATDVMQDADGSLIVFDTGAWFIHGCPISRVAKPEIKGAIYRISRQNATRPADPRGNQLDWKNPGIPELVKRLDDPRLAVRDRAVEALITAGAPAVDSFISIRKSASQAEKRLTAVYALYRLGTPEARNAVRDALTDSDYRVRAAAARGLGMDKDRESLGRLSEMVKKEEPVVRRRAAAALGQIGDPQAVSALLSAAANPDDRYVEHSIIYSLIELKQPAAVSEGLRSSDPKVRKAALIALDQMDASPLRREQVAPLLSNNDKDLRSAALWVISHHAEWAGAVVQYVSARLREPNLSPEELDGIRESLLAFSTNPEIQNLEASLISGGKLSDERVLFLLDTMEASQTKETPAVWRAPLASLLASAGPEIQTRTVELIRVRGIPGFDEKLREIAASDKSSDNVRATALSALVSRDPKLTPDQFAFLTSRLSGSSDPVLRQAVARVIGRANLESAQLLDLANQRLPKADALVLASLLDCFRSSKDPEVGKALIDVLKKSPSALGTLGEERLKTLFAGYPADVKQLTEPLFQQLRTAQEQRAGRLQKLEPLLTAGGDTGRGRRVFFGEKAGCSSCHMIGKEGKEVGPDLTGIGSIRSGHDLLEAIVYPSSSFVPGHEVYNVDTKAERYSGVIRSQTANVVVLITGPDGAVRIPRNQIRSITPSEVSLMPEGFDETLSREELTDLLAFLQAEKAAKPAR